MFEEVLSVSEEVSEEVCGGVFEHVLEEVFKEVFLESFDTVFKTDFDTLDTDWALHILTASSSSTTTATSLSSVDSPCMNNWETKGAWLSIPSTYSKLMK